MGRRPFTPNLEGFVPPWTGWPTCLCGTDGCVGLKLARDRLQLGEEHVVGCICPSHVAEGNQRFGRRAHRRGKARLGRSGAPKHEERDRVISLEVLPESKAGAQVPASFRAFEDSAWFRDALRQSELGCPVGSGAMPAVMIDGAWLVVDIRSPAEKRREARS